MKIKIVTKRKLLQLIWILVYRVKLRQHLCNERYFIFVPTVRLGRVRARHALQNDFSLRIQTAEAKIINEQTKTNMYPNLQN